MRPQKADKEHSVLVGVSVQREIDFEVRQYQGFEDVLTVLVRFGRDALDVNPGRGIMTMPERILSLAEEPCALGHHPRGGVARLAQINLADLRLPGLALRVLDEGKEESCGPGPRRVLVQT